MGLAASTVQKILNKAGLDHLRRSDRATRTPPMRYVRERPSELVHVGYQKTGFYPRWWGWRIHGRDNTGRCQSVGYVYIHSAVDKLQPRRLFAGFSQMKPAAQLQNPYRRTHDWFAKRGVTIERVLTDNGGCYRSRQWREAMRTTNTRHKHTRAYRPQDQRQSRTLPPDPARRMDLYTTLDLTNITHNNLQRLPQTQNPQRTQKGPPPHPP